MATLKSDGADYHATPPAGATADASVGRLGRDTLIYGLGFLLQRAAGFVMLPIYTQYLSPSAYAQLQLLQMTLDVTSIVLAAGITAGVYRYYFDDEDPRRRRAVIVSSWVMLLAFNLIGSVALWATADVVAVNVLKDASTAPLVWIIAASFAIDPCITIPALYMQVQQRAALYTGLSLVRLGLQLTLNIVFVVFLDAGVEGILYSTLITYALLGPVLVVWMLRQTGWTFMRSVAKRLFLFGLPYRLTDAGSFVLTYADRYILPITHGLVLTGVYSLAYQFGFLVGYLGAVPFFMAWNPQRFQLVQAPKAERDARYNQGFVALTLVLCAVAAGVSLFVSPTLVIMAKPAYHQAADFVPLIMAAYVCQAWGQVFEFGIQVSERTRFATYGTAIAVAAISVAYVLLIPPYGAWGAAVATLIGLAVRAVAFYVFAQQLFPIAYRFGPPLTAIAYTVVAVVGYFAVRPSGLLAQIGLAAAVYAVLLGLLWRGGALSATERAQLVAKGVGLWRRYATSRARK